MCHSMNTTTTYQPMLSINQLRAKSMEFTRAKLKQRLYDNYARKYLQMMNDRIDKKVLNESVLLMYFYDSVRRD